MYVRAYGFTSILSIQLTFPQRIYYLYSIPPCTLTCINRLNDYILQVTHIIDIQLFQ